MAFVLKSNITIGPYKDVKVNDVKIKKSMFNYADRAVIKVPISARVRQVNGLISETSTATAALITEGMPVNIELGYNDRLVNEFVGFVARVNLTTPCEIECEGYSYLLRKKRYLKAFKNTTLKELLQYLVNGTDITLSPLIPELKVAKWVMNNQSGTEVLEAIKKELLVAIFFTGNELYAGLQYLQEKATTKYRIGWNVIKDNELKLREAKNQEVIVVIKGERPDGSKVTARMGEKGEIKQITSHAVTDPAALKAIAGSEQRKLSYDGYEGKILTFLQPYCEPGYAALIDDPKYPQRSGKYLVDAVEVSFGMTGGRRSIEIGFKL